MSSKTAPIPPPASGTPSSHHDDELVHVPKGRSKLQFVVLVGILILMLVTFSISGSVQGVCAPGSPDAAVLTWQHPRYGRTEVSGAEFMTLKRRLEGRTRQTPSDAEVAGLIIADALARDAGIEISDAELREKIREVSEQAGGTQAYKQIVQSMEGGLAAFEETTRMLLRQERYLQLMGVLASQPIPSKIDEMWKQEHVETSWEYVAIAVADRNDEARAALPADAELEAWFAARPEPERKSFETPERIRAEVAHVSVASAPDVAALLAKYPPAADADAEKLARQYFDAQRYARFRRPEPLPEPAPGEPGSDDPSRRYYFGFDEVAEACGAEAPIHAALGAWLDEVKQRTAAGETVDLAAESRALGLAFVPADTALSVEEWRAHEVGKGAGQLVGRLLATKAGELVAAPVVGEGMLAVARVLEKLPPALPPFAEIESKVADAWVAEHAAEIALEELAALRAKLAVPPAEGTEAPPADGPGGAEAPATDGTGGAEAPPAGAMVSTGEAEFAAAASAAGLQVALRDWRDRAAPPDDAADAPPADAFLRAQENGAWKGLAAGQVPEPALDATRTQAFLARLAGTREVDPAAMTPAQFHEYERRAAFMAGFEFRQQFSSPEALRAQFGMRFAGEPES